jgi:serine/threonine-protein kinase
MASDERLAGLGAAPRVLGRYRIVAELARGSTSVVYLGIVGGPGGFNKLFALKQLRPALLGDAALVAMFVAEARLAASLSHPNVVQTLEIDEDASLPYIVMEHLEGQPLHRVIARARMVGANLPIHMHLAALGGALDGLAYAHEACGYDGTPLRIVHRDVSPHNLFLTYGGLTKVLDFGIAQGVDPVAAPPAAIRGRVGYMAPEQAAGGVVDARSDLFSVGVMMWEAVSGRRFWSEVSNENQIFRALADGQLPASRGAMLAGAPAGLRDMLMRATAPDPADRYESAAAFQADLQGALRRLTPPTFTMRDLGARLIDLFADERARLQAAIDTQLEIVRGMATAEYAARPLARLEAFKTPPPPAVVAPPEAPSPVPIATAPSHPPPPYAAPPAPVEETPNGSSRAWAVSVSLALVLTAAVGVAVARSRANDAAGRTPSPPPSVRGDARRPPTAPQLNPATSTTAEVIWAAQSPSVSPPVVTLAPPPEHGPPPRPLPAAPAARPWATAIRPPAAAIARTPVPAAPPPPASAASNDRPAAAEKPAQLTPGDSVPSPQLRPIDSVNPYAP